MDAIPAVEPGTTQRPSFPPQRVELASTATLRSLSRFTALEAELTVKCDGQPSTLSEGGPSELARRLAAGSS